ncbi:CG13142 [Drosophila busckii]|uniref:Non-structural maintenance of chromosomes element 4 n=1 Tax=Drosophila busckii TaxID=30019 RepID=A0A0M3QTQ2_DROBS|nr:CG13142 [Drosophila busckii]
MESSQAVEQAQENERIIELQDLIEQNINIDHHIESSSFGESLTAIQGLMDKANEIVSGYEDRRTNPTELVLDTELLRRNHKVVAKAIQYNTNITDKMFCTAIKNIVFNDSAEDWDVLCALACPHGTAHFTNASMLPFIDVKPKQHVQRQRTTRTAANQAEEKRPTQSDNLERKDEGAAAVNHAMRQIKEICRANNNQPIPYYKLIINPKNFMDTVQNALLISFLVKEQLLHLDNADDGLPQISIVSSAIESNTESQQAICGLDMKLCEVNLKH